MGDPHKMEIIDIVGRLRQRTGRSYEAIRTQHMREIIGIEMSRDEFDRRFRTRPGELPTYDINEVIGLIWGYLQGLGDEQRCMAREAIRLFELTGIAIADYQRLRLLFPPDEFDAAIQRRFAELDLLQTPTTIQGSIYDFVAYIQEKTRGFVGRNWIFEQITRFLTNHQRGYFFIVGDPGIGKSALAGQLVKTHGFIHHFNIRAEGINKPAIFLRNICSQLIDTFGLNYTELPAQAFDDAGFLNRLLNEVSSGLAPHESCVIVVDALDEVEQGLAIAGINPLYLPTLLPEGIYFVVTVRDDQRYMPRVACESETLYIQTEASENRRDVADYIRSWIVDDDIQHYIARQGIDSQMFVKDMVNKSEGNFMYLRYVLPEIQQGAYQDQDFDAIPTGLVNYYEDHWRRMRGQNEDAWFRYKLPVLVALSVMYEPASLALIAEYSGVKETSRVLNVVQAWSQFLHEEKAEIGGHIQKRYRLYHASFFEFIASKEQVTEERVNLDAAKRYIAGIMWDDFHQDSDLRH